MAVTIASGTRSTSSHSHRLAGLGGGPAPEPVVLRAAPPAGSASVGSEPAGAVLSTTGSAAPASGSARRLSLSMINNSGRRFRGAFLVVFRFVRRGATCNRCTEIACALKMARAGADLPDTPGMPGGRRNRGCRQLVSRHTGNPFICQLDDERAAVDARAKELDAGASPLPRGVTSSPIQTGTRERAAAATSTMAGPPTPM